MNDPVVDEPHESSGTEVGVPGGLPVLLAKGIPGLAARKVQAVLHSPFADPLELVLPGAAYSLRVVDRRRNDYAKQTPSRLLLESDGLKQVPYEWPTGLLDEHCELIRAGGLDGDGRLDLFMSLSDHYNVAEFTLFLSSKREPGSLMRKVTSLRTTGC